MQALLSGGPVDGKTRTVPQRPPDHLDVEIADETPDAPISPGEEFPEMTFTTHLYRLSHVEVDQQTGVQHALYVWLQQIPDER